MGIKQPNQYFIIKNSFDEKLNIRYPSYIHFLSIFYFFFDEMNLRLFYFHVIVRTLTLDSAQTSITEILAKTFSPNLGGFFRGSFCSLWEV